MKIFSAVAAAAFSCAIALPSASAVGEAMPSKRSLFRSPVAGGEATVVAGAAVVNSNNMALANRRKLEQMLSALDRNQRVLRQLQSWPPACNSTYNALWEDPVLNAAYNTFDAEFTGALAFDSNACFDNGLGDFTCYLEESTPSASEFSLACTAASGDVVGVPLDIYCTYYTPDGVYGSIYYDLPEYLDCLPSSADFAEVCDPFYFQDYNSGLSGAESDIEQGFFDSGYTFVQCEVGTPDRGGDDDVLETEVPDGVLETEVPSGVLETKAPSAEGETPEVLDCSGVKTTSDALSAGVSCCSSSRSEFNCCPCAPSSTPFPPVNLPDAGSSGNVVSSSASSMLGGYGIVASSTMAMMFGASLLI